ncbi:SPAG5 protein, partial [Pardalotus punctatus]|nr:SPAG5 protein [Pardalotus punctatus]
DGSAGPLHCQGTPEGSDSPAPVPPEQSQLGLPPIEASGLEPVASETTVTSVTSPTSTLGAVSWMLPLVWLEKTLNTSFRVESLQHSLLLHKPQQDASSSVVLVPTAVASTSITPVSTMVMGTGMTPVPTAVAGTSMTPVPTVVTGTSTTPVPTVVAGTSTTPVPTVVAGTSTTPVPLSVPSCPREQMKTLPRAELEGRLESTLIIIEALSLRLRDWQQSQRLQPGVGPAEQRDAFTQTDITHPERDEEIYQQLCLKLRRKTEALQLELGATGMVAVTGDEHARSQPHRAHPSGQCHQGHGSATLSSARCCLPSQREQVSTLVSQSHAMLERVPGKLQSCMEELAAAQARAEE